MIVSALLLVNVGKHHLRKHIWNKAYQNVTSRTYSWAAKKVPDLTKDRYPVKRGAFAEVQDSDVQFFESILGKNRVITDESDTQSYNIDFMASVRGCSRVVLKPSTTQEVSEILRHCNNRKLAVCPQAGNTGLVGGSVPVFDEIVISTQLMDKIEKIDEYSGTLVCQSGCILEKLEEKVHEKGLCMPLDLGAKGSCLIGGNVSTNAGGLRLLRYGNLHGSVMGVEAVTADGTIIDLMSNFKKDNTGYHLKHLFIGSEGTLGIVTKLAMFCPTKSAARNVAFLGFENYDSVLYTYLAAKKSLSEILSTCEVMDAASVASSVHHFNLKMPIAQFPFYMFLETYGSRGDHDAAKLNDLVESSITKGLVKDGIVTSTPSEVKSIWNIRKQIAPSLRKEDAHCFKYELSLPLSHFYEAVDAVKMRVGDLAKVVCGFGHIGDSTLLLNVSCTPEHKEAVQKLIEPFLYEFVAKLDGSISAEHGVGLFKANDLQYSKSPEALTLMKQVKLLMDPNGILNPYKVLPTN